MLWRYNMTGRPRKYLTDEDRERAKVASRARYNEKMSALKDIMREENYSGVSQGEFVTKLIENEYLKYWDLHNSLPSATDICIILNLPHRVVKAYLGEARKRIFADRCPEYRVLSKMIIAKQADKAIREGDTQAAKLFLQATKDLDTTPDVNINFIEPMIIRNEDGVIIETLGSEVTDG